MIALVPVLAAAAAVAAAILQLVDDMLTIWRGKR